MNAEEARSELDVPVVADELAALAATMPGAAADGRETEHNMSSVFALAETDITASRDR